MFGARFGEKFSTPKLNGTNWQSWKLRLEMLLAREDLWDVIEEELPAEADRSADWKKSDLKAKALIVLLLEDSQLSLLVDCVYARDAYETLRRYHERKARSVRLALVKGICSTNQNENGDAWKHLQELDELCGRLDAASMELDKCSRQQERKGENYESEKVIESAEGEPCKELRTCYFCRKAGHIKRSCRKIWKAKEDDSSSDSSTETDAGEGARATIAQERRSFASVAKGKSSPWMIASGSSTHMTNDRSFFKTFRKCSGLVDGRQILGEGYGELNGIDGSGRVVKIKLEKVKFVPELPTNLISVEKLAQRNLKVFFKEDCCEIVNSKREIVVTGNRDKQLYNLRIASAEMVAADKQKEKQKK